jgi:uncharacterized protein (TIGR00369 family)
MAPTISLDTDQLHTLVPMSAALGMSVAEASPETVRLHMDWQEQLCTAGGVLHGGALMSLADTAGAVCAFLNLPEGAQGTTTIESKTNLLAAVRAGTVAARSAPLHAGSRVIVVETEMRDDDGQLVAKTTQTQAVLRG